MRSLIASPNVETRMDLAKLVSRFGICDNIDLPEGLPQLIESAYADEGPYDVVFLAEFPNVAEIVDRLRNLEKTLTAGGEKARIITFESGRSRDTSADADLTFPINEQNVLEALGPLKP